MSHSHILSIKLVTVDTLKLETVMVHVHVYTKFANTNDISNTKHRGYDTRMTLDPDKSSMSKSTPDEFVKLEQLAQPSVH